MSLFKVRDWWSTSAGEAEEFDNGCLCVANIDNSSDGLGKSYDTIYNLSFRNKNHISSFKGVFYSNSLF